MSGYTIGLVGRDFWIPSSCAVSVPDMRNRIVCSGDFSSLKVPLMICPLTSGLGTFVRLLEPSDGPRRITTSSPLS
jgi:hypothetical protein